MKTSNRFDVRSLPGATFGGLARFSGTADAAVKALETDPEPLLRAFYDRDCLLVLPDMHAITDRPELLVRLSRLFGPEVEDYRRTLTEQTMVHDTVSEIFIVANRPPVNRAPPARPEPPLTDDGGLPLQFPHRRGWHTDQSFRRPPPDISLFYAVVPTPKGQGQTLYANGIAAYEALSPAMKNRLEGLEGIHVLPGKGRSEQAVRAGETPQPLLPHQRPQRQPVVRVHPVTGKRALYLCEAGQMDWVDGPFADVQPGPDGDGGALLYELMSHLTQPQFTYIQDWSAGDLVVYDNRSLAHAATWFDTDAHGRVMWRTTVRGNPGDIYAGEERSWIPEAAAGSD